MRFTVIFVFALIFINLTNAQNKRKNRRKNKGLVCHLKDVEKCLDTLSSMGKNENPTAIIATSEGLDKFCGTIKNKFSGCIRDYFKKCGTPLHREVLGLVLDQILGQTNDICLKGPKREKFLKSSPCLHEKVLSQSPVKEECNNRYLATLNSANQNRNDSLDGICCGYRFWEDCTGNLVKSECGDSGLEAFQFLISSGFMDFPNLTCPKDVFLLESNECKNVISPKTKNIKLNVGDTGVGKYNVANMFSWMFQV